MIARRVSQTAAREHFTAGGAVAVLDSRDGWGETLELGAQQAHTSASIGWGELVALCAGDPGPARTLWYALEAATDETSDRAAYLSARLEDGTPLTSEQSSELLRTRAAAAWQTCADTLSELSALWEAIGHTGYLLEDSAGDCGYPRGWGSLPDVIADLQAARDQLEQHAHQLATGCALTRDDFHPSDVARCADGGTREVHP